MLNQEHMKKMIAEFRQVAEAQGAKDERVRQIADAVGMSPGLFQMYVMALPAAHAMGNDGGDAENIIGKIAVVNALLCHLGQLESKARRYDLLIDAEKKGNEEMAGK